MRVISKLSPKEKTELVIKEIPTGKWMIPGHMKQWARDEVAAWLIGNLIITQLLSVIIILVLVYAYWVKK
jgi:hypothetical protein